MTTKEKLLHISFQTFLNNGYENTSMNDLVKASGLSKGAFYHYYPNKQALYAAVINTYFLSYYQNIPWESFEKISFNELEIKIKSFYINFVQSISAISNNGLANYYIMFFEASKYHPEFIGEIQKFYFKLHKILERTIQKENLNINPLSLLSKYEGLLFWLLIFPDRKI
ncbi:MAG: TetR/AcrR family transcriptional regulator, partial [Calditrichaeota bacterium]